MVTRYRAEAVIPAPPQQVFDVLTSPARHGEFDASGMVGQPASPGRLTHAGQVFVMNMTYRDGDDVEHYQSDNHVAVLDPPHAVGWAPAMHGGEPLGWEWRYDVEPAPDGAAVTLTYDWTRTPPENTERFGLPLMDADGLARSLQLLSQACLVATAQPHQ